MPIKSNTTRWTDRYERCFSSPLSVSRDKKQRNEKCKSVYPATKKKVDTGARAPHETKMQKKNSKRFSSTNLTSVPVPRASEREFNGCSELHREYVQYSRETEIAVVQSSQTTYIHMYKTGQILHALYRQSLTVLGFKILLLEGIQPRAQRLFMTKARLSRRGQSTLNCTFF